MRIDHIYFLIHPCCYEQLDVGTVHKDNLSIFVEREEQVKERWREMLSRRPANTWYIQLGGPQHLLNFAVENLGERASVYLRSPFPDNMDYPEYYRRLAEEINTHMAVHDLEMDTDTVTSELWGESFEGCVPGYGGAFAEYLHLGKSTTMRFEITVLDSRFLYQARRIETVSIPDSDVEGWIFECFDGTSAAIFQARRTAQWLDKRRIQLHLDDRRTQVSTKLGHTLWPPTPWAKGKEEHISEYSMTMADCNWRWIRSISMPFDNFCNVIQDARLSTASIKT